MRTCHDLRHPLALAAILVLAAAGPCALGQAPATAAPPATAPATAAAGPDLDARIERLVEQLEAQRLELHVPGMAIVVVKDDEVILSRGFGLADVEGAVPVTPETLFAIGSSTKAFTTAAIALLVDEGAMAWDDPVTKYLPELALDVDTGDEVITIRDLCCHRTGFTRMGLLWAGGTVPREAVLELAGNAKPWKGFREEFLYNNVMFMAAGMASGVAAERDWDTLIEERLLVPLGMTSSGTHVSLVRDDPRLAKGYLWDEETEAFERLPMRELDVIGPAGSINSSVIDMAGWLRFQLGRGELAGRRLLSAEALEETWKPQMKIGPGIDYGLGWMVREWNGQRLIEHGGNIDGFAAEVALLPDARTGFVLLTNVTMTPLQATSPGLVFDTLLGESGADGPALSQSELEPFVGVYIANMGRALDNAELTVLVKNGNLAVDVPGQMTFELEPPDDEGKWYFALTDQIAVRFNRDGEEPAHSMVMYQAGMQFEVPRKGHEFEPEIPLDELQKYLGAFHSEDLNADCTVIIQNNRLAVDVPGQMAFELHPPDEDGVWAFRVRPDDLQARFNVGADGAIESMTTFQDGEESLLPRVAGETAITLPTIDELIALVRRGYGVDERGSIGTAKLTGTVEFIHQGASGGIVSLTDGTDRYRLDFDFGELGFMAVAVDGASGWSDSSFHPFDELSGKELAHRRLDHPLRILGDWRTDFDRVAVLRADRIGEEPVFVVKLEKENVPPRTVHVSAERGVVLREESAEIAMQGAMTLPLTIEYGDFREVEGLTLPFRMSTENEWNGRMEVQLESIELDVALPENAFAPATDAAAAR